MVLFYCLKAQGKAAPKSTKLSKTQLEPGEVMYFDANEGLPASRHGNTIEYLVGDGLSGQVQPYHCKTKDADTVLGILKDRFRYVERVTGRKMKKMVIRCDWALSHWGGKVTAWLRSQGIDNDMRQGPAPGAENHSSMVQRRWLCESPTTCGRRTRLALA